MAISARLAPKTQLALQRYCNTHGITKTQALEQGIALLLCHENQRAKHPAFIAFERLRDHKSSLATERPSQESTTAIKRHLDAKYPR